MFVLIPPLLPKSRTVVGTWRMITFVTIIHFVHRKVQRPLDPLSTSRWSRDQRTTLWPVTIPYQPIVIRTIASHLLSPWVIRLNLKRNPSACGIMQRLDINRDQKYSPWNLEKVKKINIANSMALYSASPVKKIMRVLTVNDSPMYPPEIAFPGFETSGPAVVFWILWLLKSMTLNPSVDRAIPSMCWCGWDVRCIGLIVMFSHSRIPATSRIAG